MRAHKSLGRRKGMGARAVLAAALPPALAAPAQAAGIHTGRANAIWQQSLEAAIGGPALFMRPAARVHRLGPRLGEPPRRRSAPAERTLDLHLGVANAFR